jgi:hypothetical protein
MGRHVAMLRSTYPSGVSGGKQQDCILRHGVDTLRYRAMYGASIGDLTQK